MRATFNKGVVVEFVGHDILVLDSDHQTVHTFPHGYLGTVNALSKSKRVPNADQFAELDRLGLVATVPGQPVSRRALFVGAGALGATLALPTAAFASSETFFVGDDVFVWGNDYVRSKELVPEPASVLTFLSTWTITVNGVSKTAQVRPDGMTFFGFQFELLEPGTILSGRLSHSNGELSNLFSIRRDGS